MTGNPIVHIEATDACNLFCEACKTPHGKNFISIQKFTTLAKKLMGKTTSLGLHWRGEPCLHPSLPELARIAQELGFKPWISTNMAVPNLSKPEYVKPLLDNLDWIEICIDGYDENTVDKYRVGAKWETVKHNLSVIGEADTKCMRKMRVLMFKYNDGKEDIYRDIARRHNIDELIFASPLIGLQKNLEDEKADEWLSANKKYQRYTRKNGGWFLNTGKCNPNPIISVHGTVHPCCIDWNLEHSLGDLVTEEWDTIMGRYRVMLPTLGGQRMCELCCIPDRIVNFREKII